MVASGNKVSSEVSVGKEPKTPKKRAQWDNQVQFLLTCMGLAVGLGNIWKFPYLAFENGGSAFLFPYVTCAFVFGLPMVYAEFVIGQYAQSAPPQAFRSYAPAFQGLGWAMAFLSGTVGIYYTTIIVWAAVYMVFILLGRMSEWTACNNDWNTADCIEKSLNAECRRLTNDTFNFQNRHNFTAVFDIGHRILHCADNSEGMSSASEEFFTNYLTKRSTGVGDITQMNMHITIALVIMWALVALILMKGIKLMGYSAYVTATLPYMIVGILFVRALTLPNSWDGVVYYLGKPDFSKIFKPQTWARALTQICFSLNIGYGGLITLSSYSKKSNNCFRDALMIICGDTFMSVFGGTAVFATMGYLAKLNGKRIEDTVKEGTALAFIVYPEAISTMPLAPVVAMLFFLMLFCLGISSEVAFVEVLCTCIYDQFHSTRKRKWAVVLSVCGLYFLLAFVMATDAGYYWFYIYNDFTGSTTGCIIAASEIILLAAIYGRRHVMEDIRDMLGPSTGPRIRQLLGHLSPYWGFSWLYICPVLALVVAAVTCFRSRMEYDDGTLFPIWAELVGWFLNLCPLIAVPTFVVINYRKVKKAGKGVGELFRVQKELSSYKRIMEERDRDNTEMKEQNTA